MSKRKRSTPPSEVGTLALGLALGAGLMYLLDPDRGRRRRALLRDQLVHGAHELEDLSGTAVSSARHLRNHAQGLMAETRARLRDEDTDDSVLEARVRTELGRLVSTPGTIDVSVREGRVALSGQIVEDELDALIAGVYKVRGVQAVENRLQILQDADSTPGLQGAPS